MSRYLHGHAPSVLASHATRTAENSCAYLLPHLREGMRLLDVGSGPGTITLDLAARLGETGQVVGIEPVEAGLEAGRAEAARRGDTRTRFELGDVFALDYPDASFDVTHAHQVLQHLADPAAALREMARVTKPGGVVAVRDADYGEMSWWPQLPELDRWREIYLASARGNGAHPDAARRLRSWANAAGLVDAEFTASSWTYATPELTRWWGDSWAQRALESRFAEEALGRGLADQAELEAISAAWARWGADDDAMFFMIHGELLARIPAEAAEQPA